MHTHMYNVYYLKKNKKKKGSASLFKLFQYLRLTTTSNFTPTPTPNSTPKLSPPLVRHLERSSNLAQSGTQNFFSFSLYFFVYIFFSVCFVRKFCNTKVERKGQGKINSLLKKYSTILYKRASNVINS